MTTSDVQPNRVVLPSTIWLAELSLELQRLGHDQATSDKAAKNALVHIVGRANWPGDAFVVDDRALVEEVGG